MALQTEITPLNAPRIDLLKIEPTSALPVEYSFSYLHTVQQILGQLLPPFSPHKGFDYGALFFELSKLLPIVKYPEVLKQHEAIPITFLCPSDYTPGVGRYIADSLSRWLIPGKQYAIVGRISLNFRFLVHPSTRFYLTQEMLAIDDLEDLELAKKNLPLLIEEMRVNILAVYHARYISSLKTSTELNKSLIFQENLSSLLNPLDELNRNLFDQFQELLSKSSENKIDQIKKNIAHLMHSRPKTFDRDLFYEIAQYGLLFREQFSSKRDPKHISRVIAYQYLFKKILQEKGQKNPLKRHLSFKILKGPLLQNRSSIGLLLGFNFLRETENFETRHLLEGLKACLPYLDYLPDSLISDRRHEKLRFFYLELVKKDKTPFTPQEIRVLREKIPKELIRQIEMAVHPIFMPRNEEEVLRNLILLSKQIKYVRDLPQVSIHYDLQSEASLVFTTIVVRLIKKKVPSIYEITDKLSSFKVELDSVRNAGFLKRKYPKEAAVLRITLDKAPFFRADHSLDLLKARQKIVQELTKAVGEFRDFNGGIILKQEEALTHLRKALSLSTPEKELLLENYFYSLRPGIMQTVYDTSILKDHFLLFQKILSEEMGTSSYQIKKKVSEKYLLVVIRGLYSSYKAAVLDQIHALSIPSHDLTTASLESEEGAPFGFILRLDAPEKMELFLKKIEEAMQKRSVEL